MHDTQALIVGAGPAGLACGAMLSQQGLKIAVLEKADAVGPVWRRHYDRLHLHTDRAHSGLPGLPMPSTYPRYPSRDQVIDYLESYAEYFQLQPVFGCAVDSMRRNGAHWNVTTNLGEVSAPVVIVATGWADAPHIPAWGGMERYAGGLVHSSGYRHPGPYVGKRVLVVGFGNSGGEIALDLAEAGVDVSLSVRGPVKILPRDLFGLPLLTWAIAQAWLPPRVADFINAPAIRWAIGPTHNLGLTMERRGPRRMIDEDGRVPLLDIGTLARIRDGSITVRGGIDHFTERDVCFSDSAPEPFDAVILATGFRPDLRPLVPAEPHLFDPRGLPRQTGQDSGAPGLYFCGHRVVPTGQLREIGIEARRIAALAAGYLAP